VSVDPVNLGSAPTGAGGDNPREAFEKVNANDAFLDGAVQAAQADASQALADAAAAQSTADAAIPSSEKGAPNGVATLDASGLVPTAQAPIVPATALSNARSPQLHAWNSRDFPGATHTDNGIAYVTVGSISAKLIPVTPNSAGSGFFNAWLRGRVTGTVTLAPTWYWVVDADNYAYVYAGRSGVTFVTVIAGVSTNAANVNHAVGTNYRDHTWSLNVHTNGLRSLLYARVPESGTTLHAAIPVELRDYTHLGPGGTVVDSVNLPGAWVLTGAFT